MSEKQEAKPSTLKPTKEFRETVKIGSASSWDKNILSLFHVAFDRNVYSDMRDFLDGKYFETPSDDEDLREGTCVRYCADCRLRANSACV